MGISPIEASYEYVCVCVCVCVHVYMCVDKCFFYSLFFLETEGVCIGTLSRWLRPEINLHFPHHEKLIYEPILGGVQGPALGKILDLSFSEP